MFIYIFGDLWFAGVVFQFCFLDFTLKPIRIYMVSLCSGEKVTVSPQQVFDDPSITGR